MKRSRVFVGTGVALAALVMLAPLVEARVGGGRSGGSRGSRSYTAPRAPSSAITPSSPASPARPTAPAPGPAVAGARPGGLFGGLGGMLGGFVLGGLLGSLLFGGLGGGLGGGIGLLDILVMAGVALLVISMLRRRTPEPAVAGGYAGGGSPAAASGPAPAGERWASPASSAGTATAGPAATDADEDLASGIEHVRSMDPAFDPAQFLTIARDLFARLQVGWSGGDLAAVRAHLTDEMAVSLEGDLARLREQGRRNHVEQVRVEAVALTEAWQEYGRDLVTVRIAASAVDYTVDDRTGAVVEGSRTAPARFEEYWTFVRPVGPNPWRLGAIQQPPA